MHLILSPQFLKDLKKHKKDHSQKLLSKILELILEIEKYRTNPLSGDGSPELLKHLGAATYSRRISKEHRLVYRFKENTTEFVTCFGHYSNV